LAVRMRRAGTSGVYSKQMGNVQLYLAIGVPIVFNGLMFTVLAVMSTSRMAALDSRMSGIESRMTALENTLARVSISS
jgi:hypothetical protein